MSNPNILFVNVDSVAYETYKMLKGNFNVLGKNRKFELPNAYAMTHGRCAMTTSTFFVNALRNDDKELDQLRTNGFVDETPGCHLLNELKDKGYTTIFCGHDGNYSDLVGYMTEVHPDTHGLVEWVGKNFDYYFAAGNPQYDFKEILEKASTKLKEPWFLVIQEHDTHLHFASKGVKNPRNWIKELESIISGENATKDGRSIHIDELNQLFARQELKWSDFIEYEKIMSIMEEARQMQLEALEYVFNCCDEFLNEQNNVVYHLIGDHHTFLGDFDWWGNPTGWSLQENVTITTKEEARKFMRTMWITNQKVEKKDQYEISDFYPMINSLFDKPLP